MSAAAEADIDFAVAAFTDAGWRWGSFEGHHKL
jgi:hypothetical protein